MGKLKAGISDSLDPRFPPIGAEEVLRQQRLLSEQGAEWYSAFKEREVIFLAKEKKQPDGCSQGANDDTFEED